MLNTKAASMSPLISIGSCRFGAMLEILIFSPSSLFFCANTGSSRVVGVPCAPPSVWPSKSLMVLMPLVFLVTMANGGWFQIM